MKTFYNSIQSCVINNGVSSNFFTLDHGVRQGDPLSPNLFIIAVETLAIAIRQKKSIKGIIIGTEEKKLSAVTYLLLICSFVTSIFNFNILYIMLYLKICRR